MSETDSNSSNELVLDNRKLIIAFLLLIAVCGGFFLIGFMEGKRQAQHLRASQAAPAAGEAATARTAAAPTPEKQAEPESKPVDVASIRKQLDWYQEVNERNKGRAKPTVKEPPARKSEAPAPAAPKEETAARKASPSSDSPPSSGAGPPTQYTVQVGAFRQEAQAEAKAASLRAKGYTCRIDPPGAASDLYLVKVGLFSTRAEAVAMRLKLEQDGFPSFIKSSR